MDIRKINRINFKDYIFPLPTEMEIDLDFLKELRKYFTPSEMVLYLLYLSLNKQTENQTEDKNEQLKTDN